MTDLQSRIGSRRRRIVGLELFSMAALGVVAMFQTGLLRRLPGPHAEAVHGSATAYRLLDTPDGLLGMFSYSATACLAAMGGEDRPHALDVALGAKAAVDLATASTYAVQEWREFRAVSPWSVALWGSTVAIAALAVPLAFASPSRVQ